MEWHIVTGSKGGVGKTLLSLLLLAHCLNKEKRQQGSTLILDLNGMNADSTALVLYQIDSPNEKTLQLNTTVELYLQNAKDIRFREARFDDEERNAQRYIVGWPANPFILMNPKLFADLLKTITSEVRTIEKNFGFEQLPLRHIIIDTNYHFCNIFGQDRNYYTDYLPGGELQGEQIHIWFLWVYRQLEKMRQPFNEKQIIRETAAAIESYLKREGNIPAPLIHVFGPAGLMTSPPNEGILQRFLTAKRKQQENYTIPEFEQLESLDSGPEVDFNTWVENLKDAYNGVTQNKNAEERAALFPEVLVDAVRRVSSSGEKYRPKNVIPLSVYHAALEHYTDKERTNAVARLMNLPLYKNHLSKLLDKL